MKFWAFLIALALLAGGALTRTGLFVLAPQPFEPQQVIFFAATLAFTLGCVYLAVKRQGRMGLYLYFFFYPFLAQTANYLNISSPFFILTPVTLGLLLVLALARPQPSAWLMKLLAAYAVSILISVLAARNPNTAMTYWAAGAGGMVLAAYLTYAAVRTAPQPARFIRGLMLSLLSGSALYFLVELVVFRITPRDFTLILRRAWDQLPTGRYFTAGYTEPAGMALVFSWIFWIVFYLLMYDRTARSKWVKRVDFAMMGLTAFFLMVSGTRAAILNIGYALAIAYLISRAMRLRSFRIPWQMIAGVAVVALVGAYLLLPRTFASERSNLPAWVTPTPATVFGRTFQLVGSTADYYKQTLVSWEDFFSNPLGSGPLNATPIYPTTLGAWSYYYSALTNLIPIGATFGWLPLALWLLLVGLLTWQVVALRPIAPSETLYGLAVVLLAVVLASNLPAASFMGPAVNWANFDRTQPVSPNTPSMLAEYPGVISGLVLGLLIGLIDRMLHPLPAAGTAPAPAPVAVYPDSPAPDEDDRLG